MASRKNMKTTGHTKAGGLLVFVSLLTLPGTMAHPVEYVVEGESCPQSERGVPVMDASARGGATWLLDRNGKVNTLWDAEHDGTYRFAVAARGTPVGGEFPFVSLFVDGRALAHFEVNETYHRYEVRESVDLSPHDLTVLFWNADAHCTEFRRQLFIDYMEILLVGEGDEQPYWEEAEALPTKTAGEAFEDVSASAGRGWNLWSNGYVETTFRSADYPETYNVTVWAKADLARGVGANMTLQVDGVEAGRWEVRNPRLWQAYSTLVTLFPETHTISMHYDNNFRDDSGDRNLRLDALRITPAPQPAPEGSAVRYEVDEFPSLPEGGYWDYDPVASSGGHWMQATNGIAQMEYTPPAAGEAHFAIRAKGSPVDGVWPRMELQVDGITRAAWNAEQWNYGQYETPLDLSAGTHTIGIAYTNNLKTEEEDRNLVLDYLEITPPPVPLPPFTPLPGPSDWPFPGYGVEGTRHNLRESALSRENVGTLVEAWRFPTPRSVTGSPAVQGGHVFFADWDGNVYAINVSTGEFIWEVPFGHEGVTSSPLVAEGRLFVGTREGEVAAFDAESGAHIWTTRLDDFEGSHVWGSPTYHDGKLYVGTGTDQMEWSEGEIDFRGALVRLDAETGAIDWKFENVPPGYTGAAVWTTPALDVENGIVYYGTSNAYTPPAHEHTDAVLALNAQTGEKRWSHQAVEGDVWSAQHPSGPDVDFAMPVILSRADDGGRSVAIGNKGGDFYLLDAETGEVRYHEKIGNKVGFFGPGASAYGRVYATLSKDQRVVSLNATTGALYWSAPVTDRMFGGVAVANGLVFAGAIDGSIHALDAGTGERLWQVTLPDADVWGPVSVAEGTLFVPYSIGGVSDGTGGVVAFRPAMTSAAGAQGTSTAGPAEASPPEASVETPGLDLIAAISAVAVTSRALTRASSGGRCRP